MQISLRTNFAAHTFVNGGSEKQKRKERFSLKIRLNLKEWEQQSKLATKLSSLTVLPTFFTEHLDMYEKKAKK